MLSQASLGSQRELSRGCRNIFFLTPFPTPLTRAPSVWQHPSATYTLSSSLSINFQQGARIKRVLKLAPDLQRRSNVKITSTKFPTKFSPRVKSRVEVFVPVEVNRVFQFRYRAEYLFLFFFFLEIENRISLIVQRVYR